VLQHPSWMDAQIGEQPFPAECVGIVAIAGQSPRVASKI
jgi:hypothetical protein